MPFIRTASKISPVMKIVPVMNTGVCIIVVAAGNVANPTEIIKLEKKSGGV